MRRLLASALFVAVASWALATTTTTLAPDDASLTWYVSGIVTGLPGEGGTKPFSCSGLTGCTAQVGGLRLAFTAGASNLTATFSTGAMCGGATSCRPADVATELTTKTATETMQASCVFTTTETIIGAHFGAGCAPCFGGVDPLFKVSWTARSGAACSGVYTTTTSSTSTSTTA